MATDGEVKINTKLDTSGVDKGVNDLKRKMNDAGKAIETTGTKSKGLTSNLAGVTKGALATAGAVAGVAVAVKKTVDALDDCAAAYRVQRKAEIALQTAAKNNPYLNDESVDNLKAFASELQNMSEVGDEVSIKIMAQLAATGRSEEQITQIMAAAVDMAAVTGNSVQNVALQLSKTYSGLAGELGEANSAIRGLTKEELENGKAIEIVANQYKGAAKETADVEVQLSNAWGDFKENIGRGWQNVTQPVKQFFLDVLADINEATSKTNALQEAGRNRNAGKATSADIKLILEEAKKRRDILQKENDAYIKEIDKQQTTLEQKQAEWDKLYSKYANRSAADLKMMAIPQRPTEANPYTMGGTPALAIQGSNMAELEKANKEVERLTAQYEKLAAAEKKAAEDAATAAKAKEKADAAAARDKEATDLIIANTKALNQQKEAIELKAELTGEEIDAGEMYNLYLQSYIDLITKSNGLITEGNTAAQARLKILEEWAKKAQEAATEEEKLATARDGESILKEVEGMGGESALDKYRSREEELLNLKKELNDAEIDDAERKKEALEKLDSESTKNRLTLWGNVSGEINGYIQQTAQVINEAANLALQNEKTRMEAELADLELRYKKGEMGEEEYQKKVAEAKKRGAKEQYKIELAQWSANILSATANTAVGVTQALAQGGVAGIITGALVGAAGAVQLASIMAAKPIQHFATGGFVGGYSGATMGADNTTIAARTGELVLNANQQRALWDKLNSGAVAGGMGGVSLTINNSASNLVTATPQINRNQIELMIDARVDSGLKNGRFNGGLNAAQSSMGGAFYGM